MWITSNNHIYDIKFYYILYTNSKQHTEITVQIIGSSCNNSLKY
jgi:hypothetical protein